MLHNASVIHMWAHMFKKSFIKCACVSIQGGVCMYAGVVMRLHWLIWALVWSLKCGIIFLLLSIFSGLSLWFLYFITSSSLIWCLMSEKNPFVQYKSIRRILKSLSYLKYFLPEMLGHFSHYDSLWTLVYTHLINCYQQLGTEIHK